ISVLPGEDWGNRVRVSLEAQQKAGNNATVFAGQIELPVHHHAKELAITTDLPVHVAGGQDLAFSIIVDGFNHDQPTFVSVLATPLPKEGDLSAPSSVFAQNIETSKNGKASIHLSVPAFSGTLRLAVFAAGQNQWGQKEFSIPVETAFAADL